MHSALFLSIINPLRTDVPFVRSQGLNVIDLQQSNFLSVLERSVTFGNPVLLQNVQETLDASLNPILTKSVIKQGVYFVSSHSSDPLSTLARHYLSSV